jgi:hypothetical protein
MKAFIVLLLTAMATATLNADDRALEVDQLFAMFDKPGSPGCSVGIIRAGDFIYKSPSATQASNSLSRSDPRRSFTWARCRNNSPLPASSSLPNKAISHSMTTSASTSRSCQTTAIASRFARCCIKPAGSATFSISSSFLGAMPQISFRQPRFSSFGKGTLPIELQSHGALNNGNQIDYALGLSLGDYRGLPDLNEYMQTLAAIEQLKNLSRQFAKLNVFSLAHCKKVYTDGPFSMLLGSTALRGEPDTNIVLYKEGNQRIIATEGRVVKNIPPTFLQAALVDCEGADVVKDFSRHLP